MNTKVTFPKTCQNQGYAKTTFVPSSDDHRPDKARDIWVVTEEQVNLETETQIGEI